MFKLEALRRAERATGFAFIAPEEEFGSDDELIVQAVSGYSAAERARFFYRAPRAMPTAGVLSNGTSSNLPVPVSEPAPARSVSQTADRAWSALMGGFFAAPAGLAAARNS
ncbi:MAG: hypothetical protein AAFO79_10545 [Pseudomonadota bacterium]